MRVAVSLCTVLAVLSVSCTSAPTPRGDEIRADASDATHEVDARTNKRRLEDLRAQLASENAEVVQWAAWRISDEYTDGVAVELRQAALRWGRHRAPDRRRPYETGAHFAERERVLVNLLDALVRLGVTPTADELREYGNCGRANRARLVLAMRVRPVPVDIFIDALCENWAWEPCAFQRAAGNWLALDRSTAALRALLDRARVELRIDVVDPGGRPGEPLFFACPVAQGFADVPPLPSYVFEPWERGWDSVRVEGPVEIGWTRSVSGRGYSNARIVEARESGHTYAADLLAWIAREAPLGRQELVIEVDEPQRAADTVQARIVETRARWDALIAALYRAGLLPEDIADAPMKLSIDVRDWRADKAIELPTFGAE